MSQSMVVSLAAVIAIAWVWRHQKLGVLSRSALTLAVLVIWRVAYVFPPFATFVIVTGLILLVVAAVLSRPEDGNDRPKKASHYDAWKTSERDDRDE